MGARIFGGGIERNIDPFNRAAGSELRDGFESFIKKHPNWMVYIRKNTKFKCPDCYNEPTQGPDITCKTCFGLGYQITFEKHPVRRVIPATIAQNQIEPFGYLAKYRSIIYTPRYFYPKSKDVYLEVEWDSNIDNIQIYGRPIRVISAFQIDQQIAFREDEVTFFGCGCDTFNFTYKDIEEWLLQLAPGSFSTPPKI